MAKPTGRGSRAGRGPAAIYTSVSALVFAVVVPLALTAHQSPPPAIAEFAPQIDQQIKNAPKEQGSSVGKDGQGEGLGGVLGPSASAPPPSGGPSAKPSTTPAKDIVLPQVKHCVGNPPRQTEDPQSPPCVNYWQGNNGGKTYQGVSANEIVIADPLGATSPELVNYFNERFQTYGRKVILKGGLQDSGSESAERADAVYVDKTLKAFGSITYIANGGWYFYDELKNHKLVGVTDYPVFTEEYMSKYSPYLYQYQMGLDREFAEVGRWACGRLAKQPARFAGDPTLQTKTRVFGVIVDRETIAKLSAQPMIDAMKANCGVPVKEYVYGTGTDSQNVSLTLQMKNDGITTLACFGLYSACGSLSQVASGEGFLPEWVLGNYLLTNQDFYMRSYWNTQQLSHAFGLTFEPRQVAIEDSIYYRAALEAGMQNPGTTSAGMNGLASQYHQLLLLFSAIQMAGPHLTPQTFYEGLQKTHFPNPVDPWNEGRVGFEGGSHGMTVDAAELYWDLNAPGPYSDESGGGGTQCYVDGGRRRSGSYPKGDSVFFKPAAQCDSGAK